MIQWKKIDKNVAELRKTKRIKIGYESRHTETDALEIKKNHKEQLYANNLYNIYEMENA